MNEHDEKSIKPILYESSITCPKCGHAENEVMPTNACQFFYECKSCGELLKPNPGDCCVYCSFGTIACPPVQAAKSTKSGKNSCCSDSNS
jgi:hypothetical protein